MAHKYIQDLLGENYNNNIIFSENTFKNKDKRNKEFKKQIEIYGFSEVETWALDYTMDCLLYERLKMYMDTAPRIINMDYWKFDIPVLYPTGQKESIYDTKNHWYEPKIENHTYGECMNLMIDYLKDSIISSDYPYDDTADNEAYEQQGFEKSCCAWDIYSILRRGGVLWW
jgi:hypothetical protein